MIVKNSPDYKSQIQKKPYFLQGLNYAREMLLMLKKQKVEEEKASEFSPISRKIGKSRQVIDQQGIYTKKEEYNAKILKRIKKNRTQSLDESQVVKGKQKHFQSHHDEKAKNHKFITSYSIIPPVQQTQPMYQSQTKSQLPNKFKQNTIFNQIAAKEAEINKIGQLLQSVHGEIDVLQIVFDNLCDCYRANQHIYSKNQKLRRQAIRLEEQKEQILSKIQKLHMEIDEVQREEKKANDSIPQEIQTYVKQVCVYNKIEEAAPLESINLEKLLSQNTSENQEEENYDECLKLNYKKLKQKFDEKNKKKGLLEPKRLQKGTSFQEQVEVISKYYESQFSNL